MQLRRASSCSAALVKGTLSESPAFYKPVPMTPTRVKVTNNQCDWQCVIIYDSEFSISLTGDQMTLMPHRLDYHKCLEVPLEEA